MATVLHGLDLPNAGKTIFSEICRVLRQEGKLVTIDIKKEEMPFGPPMHLRLSHEEITKWIEPYGLKKEQYVDLGNFYMMQNNRGQISTFYFTK